jgi:hypothetical protein
MKIDEDLDSMKNVDDREVQTRRRLKEEFGMKEKNPYQLLKFESE